MIILNPFAIQMLTSYYSITTRLFLYINYYYHNFIDSKTIEIRIFIQFKAIAKVMISTILIVFVILTNPIYIFLPSVFNLENLIII